MRFVRQAAAVSAAAHRHSPSPQANSSQPAEPVRNGVVQTSEESDTSLQAATPEELKAMHPLMLDRYINACARRMFDSQKRYEATGCFAEAGARDYWYRAEANALVERGNRPEVVARLERERGIA